MHPPLDFVMQWGDSNRILFIVHREQIAKQAMKSYKNVFGRNKTYGLLSGNSKDTDADILFATMQMMSKEEVMTQFQKDCFKTIVIDEAHRTGATSYLKIMDYFEPEFWLDMTASPERTDDKISKKFYYLGRMTATGNTNEFIMANTDKTAVEIEWKLDTPVREDIYQYIVNG